MTLRNVFFKKSICSLVVVTFTISQMMVGVARAGVDVSELTSNPQMSEYGKQADSWAKGVANQQSGNMPQWSGSSIQYTHNGEVMTIDQTQITPTQQGSTKFSSSMEDLEQQQDYWDDDEGMNNRGREHKDSLFKNAKSDTPTIEGVVYSLLVDEATADRPDMSKEAWLQRSQDILENLKNELEKILNCQETTTMESSGTYTHVPDFRQCDQLVDKSGTCKIKHNYDAHIVKFPENFFSYGNCGENCTEAWVGSNDIGPCGCCVNDTQTAMRILHPEALTKVTLSADCVDDHMIVYLGKNGAFRKVLSLPSNLVPNDPTPTERPEFVHSEDYGGGACELHGDGGGEGFTVDVTHHFRNADPNEDFIWWVRAVTADLGCGVIHLQLHYDPRKALENDEWTNAECMDVFKAIDDGYAKGEVFCSEMPTLQSDGSTVLHNSVRVKNEYFPPAPVTLENYNIKPLCKEITVNANFNYYKGDTGCWQGLVGFDDDGKPVYEEVCGGTVEAANLDTCQELIDKGCTFVKSQCTEGMTGESGNCYMNDVTYDCGGSGKLCPAGQVDTCYYGDTPYTCCNETKKGNDISKTSYSCLGIACAGEECLDVDRTYNTNFGKVSALMQMVEFAGDDLGCVGLDGSQGVSCTIFDGKSGHCKKTTGAADCCKSPGGVGIGDYITLAMTAMKGHQAATALQYYKVTYDSIAGNVIYGGGEFAATVRNVAGQYSSTVGQPLEVLQSGLDYLEDMFHSGIDSIVGGAKEIGILDNPLTRTVQELVGKIDEAITAMTKTIFGGGSAGTGAAAGGAAGAATTTAEDQAKKSLMQKGFEGLGFSPTNAAMMTSVVNFVMWVYAAYQITKMVLAMIGKCNEGDFETAAKAETGSCHFVGSYTKKIGLGIKKKYKSYCCYQSPLARIVNEQVKKTQPQVLGLSGDPWGSAEDPICGGIPIEKIDSINWDLIDLSEWEGIIASNDLIANDNLDLSEDKLTGNGVKNLLNENKDRKTVSQRAQDSLQGQDVDQLRIQGAKCFSMYLGDGVHQGGECVDTSDTEVTCRKNGAVVNCDEISKSNMLDELLEAETLTNKDYANQGIICYNGTVAVDCQTLWSDELVDEVLEEYATIIGGTTYESKYVCTDSSGTVTEHICEEAVRAISCLCITQENFVCREGGKVVDCATLPATTDMSCPENCAGPDVEGIVCLAGAATQKIDAPGVPAEGYICTSIRDDENDQNISDWIVDVEPTCTSTGSKHKENLITGEIVVTKVITKTCENTDPNKACNKVTVCPYGGTVKTDAQGNPITNSDGGVDCDCRTDPPDCSLACPKYGGKPKRDGTDGCSCYGMPYCGNQCPNGGTPKENGTQECNCNAAADCASECTFGGEPIAGTNKCRCKESPACRVNDRDEVDSWTAKGSDHVIYTNDLCLKVGSSYQCQNRCLYGGTPKKDGTLDCNCASAPTNCNSTSQCPYGGEPEANGSQDCRCYDPPRCGRATVCPYGGEPVAGSQNCSCYSEPNCEVLHCSVGNEADCQKEICKYGGTPRANGTKQCDCWPYTAPSNGKFKYRYSSNNKFTWEGGWKPFTCTIKGAGMSKTTESGLTDREVSFTADFDCSGGYVTVVCSDVEGNNVSGTYYVPDDCPDDSGGE